MKKSFKIMQLILISGFLGAALLGPTQPASAGIFGSIKKAAKGVGKAAGSVAKDVG
jgi:hypothetical protein